MSVEFSANLSALRRDRGISQKQAALELGVSQALLSHYEKGIRECSLDFVKKIADYYNVTADYLLGITDSRQRAGELFETGELQDDQTACVKTVLREIVALSAAAENADESGRQFFTDFFALCVKKYLAATGAPDKTLCRLCDVSLNRLCDSAPQAEKPEPGSQPPAFAQTVGDHAVTLLSRDMAEAFQ